MEPARQAWPTAMCPHGSHGRDLFPVTVLGECDPRAAVVKGAFIPGLLVL